MVFWLPASTRRRPLSRTLACGAVLGLLVSDGSPASGSDFPVQGLLPKEEIGALRFLSQFPEHDGRGVVVAIFDTGVDPGAPGLQTTSDGQPKIVDVIDATGSGDVDTSTVRELTEGAFRGLSGRMLRPGQGWKNPSGKYHVGLKRAYELFPGPLVGRLKQKRKETWDERQRALEARLRKERVDWDAAHPRPSEEEKRVRRDLDVRIEQLEGLQKAYDDPGPFFDCVVFHDGSTWRAVLDTDEDGDLGEETVLTNYRAERRHGTVGGEALLNYALNIQEEGRRLSIVVDSGTHGTHVAGIVAAHFPEQPELNGVAPGARIVSVKIGDTRLGGMETATAFVRGLAAVRELKCDVINLSYGEPSALPDDGRLMRMVAEIVNEDGVIFVSSAGNEGPALSTVGAPGGTSSALIGVGAYVSPEMMAADYSLRERLPETHFTWSSRGPAQDGDWGVDVSAPGAAFSPVPNWTLQRSEMMNGTSMASPNAAGAVALLLSGLKAGKTPYTPHSIRRALENSARPIQGADPFALGRGLVQVDAAFALAQELAKDGADGPRFEVAVTGRGDARGIYLREPAESQRVLATPVRVTPVFPKNAEARRKVEFERRFRLQPTAPWVTAASHLMLVHDSRAFDVRVDPTGLEPGVHTAEILGFELESTNRGPAFRVPITVIRPSDLAAEETPTWRDELDLGPGEIERRFFAVPPGASWAELTVEAGPLDSSRRLIVHAVQLRPRASFTTVDVERSLALQSHGKEVVRLPVDAGRTLELCIAQQWSSLGAGSFRATLQFRGIQSARSEILLDAAARIARVEVSAPTAPGRLAPRGRLVARRRTIPPVSATTQPSSNELDRLPGGRRIHELILTYPFTMDAAATVVPRFPALNARLYDGEFESQLWTIFDSGKRLVTVDDGWAPGEVKLEKGGYQLRFHLRHDRADWLDKLKSLPLVLDQQLGSPIALRAYADPDQALVDGDTLPDQQIARGESAAFHLAAPEASELAKAGKPGELLVGTLELESPSAAVPILLFCTVPPATPEEKPREAEVDDRSPPERLTEARRDFRVSQLDGLTGPSDEAAFAALLNELKAEFPDHLPLYVKELHRIDNEGRDGRLRSVVAAADLVISRIDTVQLAAGLGARPNDDDPKVRRERKELERKKEILVDALYRKGRALAWMELPDDEEEADGGAAATKPPGEPEPPFDAATVQKGFEETYAELRRWVDPTEEATLHLHIRREWRQGRLGEVLRLLQQQIGRHPADLQLHRKRIEVLRDLGWTDWTDRERAWLKVRFPRDYAAF